MILQAIIIEENFINKDTILVHIPPFNQLKNKEIVYNIKPIIEKNFNNTNGNIWYKTAQLKDIKFDNIPKVVLLLIINYLINNTDIKDHEIEVIYQKYSTRNIYSLYTLNFPLEYKREVLYLLIIMYKYNIQEIQRTINPEIIQQSIQLNKLQEELKNMERSDFITKSKDDNSTSEEEHQDVDQLQVADDDEEGQEEEFDKSEEDDESGDNHKYFKDKGQYYYYEGDVKFSVSKTKQEKLIQKEKQKVKKEQEKKKEYEKQKKETKLKFKEKNRVKEEIKEVNKSTVSLSDWQNKYREILELQTKLQPHQTMINSNNYCTTEWKKYFKNDNTPTADLNKFYTSIQSPSLIIDRRLFNTIIKSHLPNGIKNSSKPPIKPPQHSNPSQSNKNYDIPIKTITTALGGVVGCIGYFGFKNNNDILTITGVKEEEMPSPQPEIMNIIQEIPVVEKTEKEQKVGINKNENENKKKNLVKVL